MNPSALVAQTGSLLCRGLAIRRVFDNPAFCRLPVGDTAGCQPALHSSWKASPYQIVLLSISASHPQPVPATEARDPKHKSGFQLDKIFFRPTLATVQHT
jgi:hypothetical protein